jgi:hypothetical protein
MSMLERDTPGALAERLKARRAQKAGDGNQGGESDGNIGQHIAREPLFVGLGLRGRHRPGEHDADAPPVRREHQRDEADDFGVPDPPPPRRSRMKP